VFTTPLEAEPTGELTASDGYMTRFGIPWRCRACNTSVGVVHTVNEHHYQERRMCSETPPWKLDHSGVTASMERCDFSAIP